MPTKDRSVGKQLTTTNSTVYTVPLLYICTIDSIIISNTSSSSKTFSLDWYDFKDNTYYALASGVLISGNSIVQITDPLYLTAKDTIRGLASADSSITITIRVKEDFSGVT